MSDYGFREYDSSLIAKEINPNVCWKVTTAPTVEPITVVQLKEFARIDGNIEDDLLTNIIKVSRQMVEDYTNRALISQTIELSMDYWPNEVLELPRPPLISITSVQTLDESNVATTYDSGNYFTITNCDPGKLVIKNSVSFPYNSSRYYAGYKVTYTAGYGSTATYIPQQLKEACKLWATVIYENRTQSSDPTPLVKGLLEPFKVYYL
jgi:uncharacterized phiE125 gp8 family phage protein